LNTPKSLQFIGILKRIMRRILNFQKQETLTQ